MGEQNHLKLNAFRQHAELGIAPEREEVRTRWGLEVDEADRRSKA